MENYSLLIFNGPLHHLQERQYRYKRDIEARSLNHCCRGRIM